VLGTRFISGKKKVRNALTPNTKQNKSKKEKTIREWQLPTLTT
jgi:hypothetical protein